MHESSLELVRCVRCGSKLELESLKEKQEIEEGLLHCKKCNLEFPILEKIPILWDGFAKYLSSRKLLGGYFYKVASGSKMKKFVKNSLSKNVLSKDDRTHLEERWSKIYHNSKNSKFYSTLKNNLNSIPSSKYVLEHGCSIGIMTSFLSEKHEMVFGIDRSYSAIKLAKKSSKENLDYFVADSMTPVFGKHHFDLVLALNILELIEPLELLKHISKQISNGYLVISDPYDFDRGPSSVRRQIDENTLRTNLQKLGFKITSQTKKPSYIPWNLKINQRATLNYKVDLVIGKK